MSELVAVVGVPVLVASWVVLDRNRFVDEREHVRESWRTVDTELQRRHDLIANLVEVVRAHAAHERSTLESVVTARARAVQGRPDPPERRAPVEARLSGHVGDLVAVAEAYPVITADAAHAALLRELVGTEDRIAAARRIYNANVRVFEQHRQRFPSLAVARLFGFHQERFFAAEPAVDDVPSVGDRLRRS